MQSEVGQLKDELRQLQQDLALEREGAQHLRRALELAATYFLVPGGDGEAEAEAAWTEIVVAIHSDAGRSGEHLDAVDPWEYEDADADWVLPGGDQSGRCQPVRSPGDSALPNGHCSPSTKPKDVKAVDLDRTHSSITADSAAAKDHERTERPST